MFDDIRVLNQQCPSISDAEQNPAEFDDWLASLPEPSVESLINYQRNLDFMLKINAEVGVFQDMQVECAPEETKVANGGKYMSYIYNHRY